jgi:hypothetical protein
LAERVPIDASREGDPAPDYPEEVTTESYREIERLALWAAARGPRFYLIGGWAAWRWHRGLGSRDIDVIFPNQTILEAFLTEYYQRNGYVRVGGVLSPSYHKPVETPNGTVYIEIDAAQLDRGYPFHEDVEIDLPYRLLERYNQSWRVGSQEVLVPTPELLLLQKVKAHRDRSWDIEHTDVAPARTTYLRGKVAKDAYDIRRIAEHIDDWERVATIAGTHSCRRLIADTLRVLGVREGL